MLKNNPIATHNKTTALLSTTVAISVMPKIEPKHWAGTKVWVQVITTIVWENWKPIYYTSQFNFIKLPGL